TVRRDPAHRPSGRLLRLGPPFTTVLRYPDSPTAAQKTLPGKGPDSFPSWTSPVRPRSPGTRCEAENHFRDSPFSGVTRPTIAPLPENHLGRYMPQAGDVDLIEVAVGGGRSN